MESSTHNNSKIISNETLHVRDVNSRQIFNNNILTCQFLRDYTGLSIFSDVQPDDIEDETTKFKMQLGIEVEGDTVKKIHIRTRDHTEEVYVISLIEHKSRFDPDTLMQLLIYMSLIWRDHAKKMNGIKKDANKAVNFRYPLIIPIVYYEGSGEWTTGMRLSDRIAHADLAREYIPDFTCKFVQLKDYDNKELIERNNEMSLIMMINKIQKAEDYYDFRKNAIEYLKEIYSGTSADIQNLILDVIWGLLMKIKVPEEEASKLLNTVKEGGDMGILFADLEPWDWKGANEKLRIERKKADAAEARADAAEARADAAEARADAAEARADAAEARADTAEANAKKANQQLLSIQKNLIEQWKSEEKSQEDAVRDMIDLFNLEEKDALDLWNDMTEQNELK